MIFSSFESALQYKHDNSLTDCIVSSYPLGMNGRADYMITRSANTEYWTGKEWRKF